MDFCGKFRGSQCFRLLWKCCWIDFEELFWLIIILKASLNKCLILRCFFSISKLQFSTGYSISEHIFLIKKFELKFYQSLVLVY